MLARRARAMYDLLAAGHDAGVQPWARLWAEGHGEIWRLDAEYAARREPDWLAALLS
jgi:hypothetical protein